MSGRPLDLTAWPSGPRDPVTATPPRRSPSVRRTTSIDQRRGNPGEPTHIEARGRDLVTGSDGAATVVDEVVVHVDIDGRGVITAIETEVAEPGLAALVGTAVARGFRVRVDAAVPHHRRGATVLHQLLDDLPTAGIISSYGSTREQPDWKLPQEHAERLTDLCAGWAAGGTMLDLLRRTGTFPIPVGPPAPALTDGVDPWAWHDEPEMVPRSIRRRRRIDLSPDGDVLGVDAHFRDSHLGVDEPEDVLHEYELTASVEPDGLVVRDARATARVLPWPECPAAVASAGRIAGRPTASLRTHVLAAYTGTSTCTHLNDVLRSLAGVPALAAALARVAPPEPVSRQP